MALRNKLTGAVKAAESARQPEDTAELMQLMTDPQYLRQSSSLINEALQKGYDVLQLPSGEIVTTGTKTIAHTFTWDDKKQELIRTKTTDKKGKKGKGEFIEDLLDE
ncbi:MAG: hypothetical protein CMM93_01000 [Rickettsiales bacterium]|nr:hypothetical protein [Rickettsiales bacterium]|tara:strand:+ start:3862 stop:4182 length:321 start_codon:yes stop_codon:yes gene_type:complete